MVRRSARRAALALLVSIPSVSNASIVAHSSNVHVQAPPSDLRTGKLESDSVIVAFAEREGFALPSELPLNITAPGASPVGTDPNYSPGSVAAGELVNTYVLHFDPVGEPPNGNTVFAEGFITLDSDILGLITRASTLNATHPIVGLPGVLYPGGDFQGIELGQPGAYVTLSADRRTVSFGLPVGPHADNLRIATAVPEVSSSLLTAFVAGVGAAAFGLRRAFGR